MIILHAGIRRGRLLLWGEQPAEAVAPARRRGRPVTKGRPVSPLPYAAEADALSAALAAAAPGSAVNQASAETVVVWLPTVGGSPLVSSPMINEPPGSSERATLAPWEVTALALPTEQALELLCSCAGGETLSQGVIVGADLAFWAQAVRFAGSIVARQAFLPGIDLKGPTPRARWEPVFAGADTQRLARFAAAMPHACRALTGTENRSPPDTPAVAILSEFLTEVVDGLVRSAFAPDSRSSVTASRRTQAPSFESVHDQWLHALYAGEGVMTSDAWELARLAEQVREWRRPIAARPRRRFGSASGWRSPKNRMKRCREVWRLHVYPPALNVSRRVARSLPAAGRRTTPACSSRPRRSGRPRGAGRAAQTRRRSGRASTCSRPWARRRRSARRIEASLKRPRPRATTSTPPGAHEFLPEKAWLLEQAGFGVLLPAWWTRKGTKLRLAARAVVESPKMQGGSGLSLDEIVKFDWEVALGDQTLTLAELEALARLKAPLVKVRGQWVQLNAEEIQAALDFWKAKGGGADRGVREVVQMALGGREAARRPRLRGRAGDGLDRRLARAARRGTGSPKRCPCPRASTGRCGPTRSRGYSWLAFLRRWGLGACLADDMGLGKTSRRWP